MIHNGSFACLGQRDLPALNTRATTACYLCLWWVITWDTGHCLQVMCQLHFAIPFLSSQLTPYPLQGERLEVSSWLEPHVIDRWCALLTTFLRLLSPQWYDTISWNLLLGQRIGEAANPGPKRRQRLKSTTATIAIVNPTSVRNKFQEFKHFIQDHGCNAIALSETSATLDTQHQVSRAIKAIWSSPVTPQAQRLDGQPSNRGRAGGAAVFSSLPCRPTRHTINEYWQATTRLLHVILTIGSTDIQIFVLYGATSSLPNASQFNDDLLTEAIHLPQLLPLPTMYMGDFNLKVSDARPFHDLFKKGYRSLDHLFSSRYGSKMPPFCKDSTLPDNAVLSPDLIGLVTEIKVLPSKLFDSHDPVIFTMVFPKDPVAYRRYQMPKSWTDLPIQAEQLQAASEKHQDLFEGVWNSKVEALVDETIVNYCSKEVEHFPCSHLPKSYRGRYKPPKAKLFPRQRHVPKGRAGDYEPPGEVCAIRTKRQIRQLRRIQSLRRRIAKVETMQDIWERTRKTLQQEWDVIVADRSVGCTFGQWAQETPEIGPLPRLVPPSSLLWSVEQMFKLQVDDAVHHDGVIRKRQCLWDLHSDKKNNHSRKAFALARGTVKPTLHTIATTVEALGLVMQASWIVNQPNMQLVEVALEHSLHFHANFPIKIGECTVWLTEATTFSITLKIQHPALLEGEQPVQQTHETSDPAAVFDALDDFWHQYWNRDPASDSPLLVYLEQLAEIRTSLPPDIPNLQVTQVDPTLWNQAIAETKKISCPGIDGVRAHELQILLQPAIKALIAATQSEEAVIPPDYMFGRTFPLQKR